MANTKEIVVTLRLEDKGALQRLGQLEIETKQYQQQLKLLNAEIVKNGAATKDQERAVGTLSASIRRNQTVIRELKNDLSGATDAGLRFRDKMAEASRAGLGAFGLQALSVTAVTTAVIAAGRELAQLAEKIELVDARNRAIAGDSLPALTQAAEENANAIGLTRREYVSLAADQQLRLKNLGLEGDLVTELAIQTVQQAEAISDFSGGELDTAQAAKLLNDALTGQTRGLKELGINVKASKEEIAAQALELQKSKGLTEEQATAVATLQLAFKATEETMAVFGDQTLAIDEAQDKATARINEAKEALAEGLQPALARTSETAADLLDVLGRFAQIQFGGPEGLAHVIQQVSDDANAAFKKGIDQFLETATDAQIRAAQLSIAKQAAAVAAVANGDAVLEAEVRRLSDIYDQLGAGIGNATTAQEAFSAEVKKAPVTLKTLNAELKTLKEAREDIAITDTEGLAANAAQIDALQKQIAAIEGTTKATRAQSQEARNAVGSIADYNAQIADLKKLQSQSTTSEQFNTYETQIDALTEKVQFLTGELVKMPALKDVQFTATGTDAGPIPEPPEIKQASELEKLQQQQRINEIKGIQDFNLQKSILQKEFDATYYEDRVSAKEILNAKLQALSDEEAQQQAQRDANTAAATAQLFDTLQAISDQSFDKKIADVDSQEQTLKDKLANAQSEQEKAEIQGQIDRLENEKKSLEKRKESFKTFAIASSLISTYLAAEQVLADPTNFTPIGKILAAASIITAGLANVAKIAGFAKGGRVEANGRVTQEWGPRVNRDNGDTVLATLRPNEAVLNEDQQERAKQLYGSDFFRRIGVPGFAIGGRTTRGSALVNLPTVSPRDITNIEAAAEQRAIEFSPVVSVVEMNRVQNRVRVIQNLSTA